MPVNNVKSLLDKHFNKFTVLCVKRTPYPGTRFEAFHNWVNSICRREIFIVFIKLVLYLRHIIPHLSGNNKVIQFYILIYKKVLQYYACLTKSHHPIPLNKKGIHRLLRLLYPFHITNKTIFLSLLLQSERY